MLGFHRGRCGRADRGSHPAPGRRRHHQHEVAVAEGAGPLRARAQRAARAGHICPITARWSAESSGPARSRATIGCASPTRSGACCRGGCSGTPDVLRLAASLCAPPPRAMRAAELRGLSFRRFSVFSVMVRDRGGFFTADASAFSLAARSMIVASIAPASPPLAGLVRDPHGGRVFAEDVLEVAVALDASRRELGDVQVAGPLVAMLDQQPAPRVAGLIRSRAPG